MRLIDADKLMATLLEEIPMAENTNVFKEMIENQPIAYDVDKVVEQLETARDGYSTAQLMTATNDELVKRFIAKEKALKLAINIVKAGGTDDVL